MSFDTVVPTEFASLAQDLMLGKFSKVDQEPHGRTLYRFQNGAVLLHKGVFAGVVLRDSYNGYRPVQVRKDYAELALRHRLGAFAGTDSAEGRVTYFFEYGAIETSGGAVESVLARGARLSGEQLMVAPAAPFALHAS